MPNKLKIIQDSQLSPGQQGTLHNQGYRLVGNHSAVKICEWTRKMIRGQGG
jgi:tRNA wybutosine-synthesizing protein 1